jgi:hypothetical protein
MKLLIVAVLFAIVVSLASGLGFLMKDGGRSKRMVNALTLRIGLSVLLFVLLFVSWAAGWIEPHGIQ